MKNLLKYLAVALMLLSGVMTVAATVFQEVNHHPQHELVKKYVKSGTDLYAELEEAEEEHPGTILLLTHLTPLVFLPSFECGLSNLSINFEGACIQESRCILQEVSLDLLCNYRI